MNVILQKVGVSISAGIILSEHLYVVLIGFSNVSFKLSVYHNISERFLFISAAFERFNKHTKK